MPVGWVDRHAGSVAYADGLNFWMGRIGPTTYRIATVPLDQHELAGFLADVQRTLCLKPFADEKKQMRLAFNHDADDFLNLMRRRCADIGFPNISKIFAAKYCAVLHDFQASHPIAKVLLPNMHGIGDKELVADFIVSGKHHARKAVFFGRKSRKSGRHGKQRLCLLSPCLTIAGKCQNLAIQNRGEHETAVGTYFYPAHRTNLLGNARERDRCRVYGGVGERVAPRSQNHANGNNDDHRYKHNIVCTSHLLENSTLVYNGNMTKLAINGFGRIGRIFFRQVYGHTDFEIVAVNDLADRENLAYLLKYDSVYGKYEKAALDHVQFFQEKDPAKLPWGKLGIDIVIESTGFFETAEKAKAHLDAGAKRVVISAPAKDDVTPTMTPNVGWKANEASEANAAISSNASCTTNATNPVVAILMNSVGIQKAMMTTVHANTATQKTVDGPGGKDMRYGRAGAWNIIPSTTGAAKATAKIIPELKSKFDAVSVRVPVISGSLIDFTFLAGRPTTVEEINGIFKKAAAEPQWQGIVEATDEPLVSSDILGNPHGAIVDLGLTRVVDADLVKVFAWYDNEWGYCAMLFKHVQAIAKFL